MMNRLAIPFVMAFVLLACMTPACLAYTPDMGLVVMTSDPGGLGIGFYYSGVQCDSVKVYDVTSLWQNTYLVDPAQYGQNLYKVIPTGNFNNGDTVWVYGYRNGVVQVSDAAVWNGTGFDNRTMTVTPVGQDIWGNYTVNMSYSKMVMDDVTVSEIQTGWSRLANFSRTVSSASLGYVIPAGSWNHRDQVFASGIGPGMTFSSPTATIP